MPQDSRGFASDPFDIGFDTVSNIRNYGFDETVPLIIRYTPLSLSFSFYIYIYVSHRRICRHVKSTCTIRISADYGNPFNGKSRIRVYKCVYTLAIQFRNLSRGLSCTVIVIDVSPRFFFPQMLQFPMNLSPTPRDRCIPW